MCFFSSRASAAPQQTTFDNSPPVVTGMQTGVDNPIDTAKVTEELKIQRKTKEGMSNPGDSLNIAGVTNKSGGGIKTAQQKANLAKNKLKAKNLAKKRKSLR